MLSLSIAQHVCAGHNLPVQHDTTNLAGCVMLSYTIAQHFCAGHNLPVQHDTTNLARCVMLSLTIAQHVCAGHNPPVQHDPTNSLSTTPSIEALKLLLSVVQKRYMNLDGSYIIKVKIINVLLSIINWTQNYS